MQHVLMVQLRAHTPPNPALCTPGNFNLDGPIYIDLQKRKNANGEVVWQIKDVYYGARGAPTCLSTTLR